jgi:hypothetical protein
MNLLFQRWRAYTERLRFKYAPRVANWLVARSTDRARAKLAPLGRIKVLVDNTVLYHAVTHETAWVSTGPKMWGPQEIDTGYLARIPVHDADSKSREYRNVRFLAGIAHLCQSGCLDLCTSAELQDEQFRQPSGRYCGYGHFDHSLFSGLEIESIDGLVLPAMGLPHFPSAKRQQRDRLEAHKREPLYSSLVQCLGSNNSQDAWHIYTAEKHGMFCFLTMDFRLIKTVAAQSRSELLKSFKTLVLTPEDFGKRFGIFPISPHILSYNDASFFVRTNLAMPMGKRRPLKGYGRGRS